MIRFRDVINYLELRSKNGASLKDIEQHFHEDDPSDIKRLLSSGVGFKEIQKHGTNANNFRYYLAGIEVNYKPRVSTKDSDPDLIEGLIDVSHCKTQKEKAETIYSSPHPISKIYAFSYRENASDPIRDRPLYDFMHMAAVDVDLKIMSGLTTSGVCKKFKREHKKFIGNKIIIGRSGEDEWNVTKIDYRCPERSEVETFTSWNEFEKCLRTLFAKR
jgi:hypothetical protein